MGEVDPVMAVQFVSAAISGEQVVDCSHMHLGSCNLKGFKMFLNGCKGVSKMYLLVHLASLALKGKSLAKEPVSHILRAVVGFAKSLLFAGGYSALTRRGACVGNSVATYTWGCLLAGVTLLFQPRGRQMEIALYCANKSMEVAYNMALRRRYPVRIQHGECLLNAVALAAVCYVYFTDREIYRRNYRRVIDLLLADV